jgi:anaerobic selenocysteine-containing dehydrogenase
MQERRLVPRVCPFCEATCGVVIEVDRDSILSVRGDKNDPFSRGFICPKAYGIKELYEDPDRLRRPLRRTPLGWREISWQEAYDLIRARLLETRSRYGNNAIGMYLGNPIVHDKSFLYANILARALNSRSVFNASAIDTLPKEIQTGLMFGGPFPATVPVPDIDHTRYLLVIGANPAVSHGSLATMPDAPGRLRGVIRRGGKVVVIDPRRTETARIATEHHFIVPGTDAAFLLTLVHVIAGEGLIRLGPAEGLVNGLDDVLRIAAEFAPERVAGWCGIPAPEIRRIAREFAAAEAAVCYGRLGTCVQRFGTLASWGVDLVNVLTGNLDRPGGAMFPQAAAPITVLAGDQPFEFGRWKSRVSGQPEVGGMIPSSTMAEEILTPGEGQVRAMILLMTNPLRSAANSAALEEAFSRLDFLVAIDFYLNETTRHADLILPTPSAAEQANYEFGLYHLSVRNVAKWSFPAVPAPADSPAAWEIMVQIAGALMGLEGLDTRQIDDAIFARIASSAVSKLPQWTRLTADETVAALAGSVGPERIFDMLIRLGPYGDGFGRRPDGLTLTRIKESRHGIDLGPLQPRLREVLNTKSGRIELAPRQIVDDVPRLRREMERSSPRERFLLIGRRNLRTSNSFMHNLPSLVKGRDRCTLQVSTHDAAGIGLKKGGFARVTSRVGSLFAPVEITDDLMPGVVSLPHGWGHDAEGTWLSVARAHAGVNANRLTDNQAYDAASGTAVLFGTPVSVEPV